MTNIDPDLDAGGNWQAEMRTKATARVEKKPKAQRDKAATDNRARRNSP